MPLIDFTIDKDNDVDTVERGLKLFDYVIYKTSDEKFRVMGHTDRFIEIHHDMGHIVRRKPRRFLIYVLAHNEDTFQSASRVFANKEGFKVIRIPSTYLLESFVFLVTLHIRKHEWQHADFVGTISWKADQKLSVCPSKLHDMMEQGYKNGFDVCAFLFRGDALVESAERWHPGYKRLWIDILQMLGFSEKEACDPNIASFYCNYFAATPDTMNEYMSFFNRFVSACNNCKDDVRELLWSDSSYMKRGKDICGLTEESCLCIFGVPYPPFIPYIAERLICFFCHTFQKKVLAIF
jgi:hypothetical protein